jgi:hypothetical protein
MNWRATDTGLVVEQKTETNEVGEASQVRKTQFTMGAEPRILSGKKQRPLGPGSEPIKDELERMGEEMSVTDAARESSIDVDVEERAKKMVEEVEARAKGVIKGVRDRWRGLGRAWRGRVSLTGNKAIYLSTTFRTSPPA